MERFELKEMFCYRPLCFLMFSYFILRLFQNPYVTFVVFSSEIHNLFPLYQFSINLLHS